MEIDIRRSRGFSLLEVIMTFAITLVLFSFTFPDTPDPGIRARVGVGLSLALEAQLALVKTCEANESAVVKNNLDAGYFYIPSGSEQDFVNRIQLGADCAKESMVIVIWTGNTGAETDPVLELSATSPLGDEWTCRLILGDVNHVPAPCGVHSESI